jgi:AAA domain
MSDYKPTQEQDNIVSAFTTGADLVVEAGAGAGKTSTLKLCAGATPRKRGLYLAYNKAIASEAQESFPPSVMCKTSHSLAFGSVGRQYAHRLKAPRQPAAITAGILGLTEPLVLGKDLKLHQQQVARLVMEGVQRFCYSDAPEPLRKHAPRLELLTPADNKELAKALHPLIVKAWQDISRIDGRLRFTHDCYLKLWALGNPQLPADYVLLDEAQDSNPCVSGLVNAQASAQKVLVGDACQAIYGWRGAVDAMSTFAGQRLYLSQSFRFGPAIAAEANKWLQLLASPLQLRGFDRIPSRIGMAHPADAVLCRTNGEAVRQAAVAVQLGQRAAIVGGGDDIRQLAEAAIELRLRGTTSHPQLIGFTSWAAVQDHVEHDAGGADLAVAVRLIDSMGAERVIHIIRSLVPEAAADIVLSTAHKAKGREWARVRVAEDFREPKPDESGQVHLDRGELMLAYVTVTRAQKVLERGGLDWVDGWVTGFPVIPSPRLPEPVEVPEPIPDPEPVEDLAGCTEGPGGTLVSPRCLRCGLPQQQCGCKVPPLTWSAMTGLDRAAFLARVRGLAAAAARPRVAQRSL